MGTNQRFGAPALITAFTQSQGTPFPKEDVSFREYPAVELFLHEKNEAEKAAEKVEFVFKHFM
ncbi:MAG: hypothetical protein HQL20_05940 [Candidatus Omnitrophica bacterium]|nr:hypothetical protein [Candidatus Omnitrophota bacterium]